MARFHDPTKGRILVNGIGHPGLHARSRTASLLAIVQQDVFLFDGSVRDNIAYGRHNADDAEIEDAARRANAHEFIEKLPEGYDTFVGERGVKLSGGQQQRLAIARAILASPQILILDEATSNLDTESEQLIQASMAELLAGRTTFVIAHRLSTVRRANLILLMEDGRIIERGTHEELMTARGMYYEMVLRQAESAGENVEAVSGSAASSPRSHAALGSHTEARGTEVEPASRDCVCFTKRGGARRGGQSDDDRIGVRIVLLIAIVATIGCDRVTKHVAPPRFLSAESILPRRHVSS